MQIAKLALEDLAAGLARQGVEKLNVLRHLEIGEPAAQKFLHRARSAVIFRHLSLIHNIRHTKECWRMCGYFEVRLQRAVPLC